MRKRIACINEAPIAESERRIAVEQPMVNSWLSEQGVDIGAFPLAGGNEPCY